MPRYASDVRQFPTAQEAPFFPCFVYDGAGVEVDHCLLVDTDTGWVVFAAQDENGSLKIDHGGEGVVMGGEYRPLPISLEPVRRQESDPCILVDAK